MNIALISTVKDIASINLKEQLLTNHDFSKTNEQYDGANVFVVTSHYHTIKLYTLATELLHSEHIGEEIEADLFLFLSKHVSEDQRSIFTVHSIGNFNEAKFGGKERALVKTNSAAFKSIFNTIKEKIQYSNYEVSNEATHHGPYVSKPSLFIEIGSTEKNWGDRKACELLMVALMAACNQEMKPLPTYAVIGGTHYNRVAEKLLGKEGVAVGHICPKHAIADLDDEMITQLVESTQPQGNVMLDWKGLGDHKQKLIPLLEKHEISYQRSDQFEW